MPTTMTGREFKAFYSDPDVWSDERGSYHDDTLIYVDSIDPPADRKVFLGDDPAPEFGDGDPRKIPDTAIVTIEYGIYYADSRKMEDQELVKVAKAWLKRQANVWLSVQVPKDKLEAVKAAIKAAGGKIEG